jgi:serpin B
MKPTKLWLLGTAIVAVALVVSVAILRSDRPAQNAKPDTQPTTITQTTHQFAFDLLKALLQPDPNTTKPNPNTIVRTPSPNLCFSPSGVQYVLSLLLNGAEGETYEEIARALGVQQVGVDALNRFHGELMAAMATAEGTQMANSIWIRPFDRLRPDFARIGAQFYKLEHYTVDFTNAAEAARRINEWSAQKTNGLVPEVVVPDEIDPRTILALVNALYMRALWAQPFQLSSERMEFDTGLGSSVKVRMMEAELSRAGYLQTEVCEVVGLPYAGDQWRCYLLVPSRGSDVEALVSVLDGSRWREWRSRMAWGKKLMLMMPRWEVRWEQDFIPVLKQLGIERLFLPAQLTRILDGGGAGFVGLFKQVCRVRVDEKGTEAGATTAAVKQLSASLVVVDRAFLYVIEHVPTGAIAFVGIVREPME